jgi:choline kinase
MGERGLVSHNYKVFLPTAGIGSRVKGQSKNLNKCLIGIDNKPVISHIIDKFHPKVPIVMALGYGGDYVRQYVEITYPERDFTFVEIDNYDGKNSGLGLTMNKCKKSLQSPFIFVSNDTIFEEQLYFDEIPSNWLGYSPIKAGSDYRSLVLDDEGNVKKLNDKIKNSKDFSYIGICGIKDYKDFWRFMKDKESLVMGESYGIKKMLEANETYMTSTSFNSFKFTWYDTGNERALQDAKEKLKSEYQPNILEKDDEAIWFANNKTIKFSVDKKFIKDRVKRSKSLEPYVPTVTNYTDNFYSYDFITGKVLSDKVTGKKFEYLLSWLDNFWQKVDLGIVEYEKFTKKCREFYVDKTMNRIDLYYKKYYNNDSDNEIVNDNKLPMLNTLMKNVDWSWMIKGEPVRFHGDLHFENILIKEESKTLPFALLDWRQSFGGEYKYGDLYYDLAKLLHGLIISHDFINQNFYTFSRNMNNVYFDFHRKNTNIECERILESYVKEKGLEWKKVKVMTALIFLNIAGLHHYPYCHLLYYLGKSMLYEELQ